MASRKSISESDLKNIEQVGKGGFTRTYKFDEETVLLESFDPIKMLLAEGKFPDSKLFPTVHHCSKPKSLRGKGGEFFIMHYYKERPKRKTKKWLKDNLKPYHYETYLSLYELRKSVDSEISGKRGIDRQKVWNEAFATLENKKLASLLTRAYNACSEVVENVMFDCEPKNVTPYKGNLILLDSFYSSSLFYKMKFSEKPEWALDWK